MKIYMCVYVPIDINYYVFIYISDVYGFYIIIQFIH